MDDTCVNKTVADKPGSALRSTGVPARTALWTHNRLFVELPRSKASITAAWVQLSDEVCVLSHENKKGTVRNSGQQRSLVSEKTALVQLDGSKSAIRIAAFSWNNKSLLLFRMFNSFAHLFAACCVLVCRSCCGKRLHLLLFGLPTSRRPESDRSARIDSNWPCR